MEPEFLKGVFHDQPHPFAHQPLSSVGSKGIIANVRPLQQSPNDIAQVNDPDYFARTPEHNQESPMRIGFRAFYVSFEPFTRVRRRHPGVMQGAAPPDCRLKRRPVTESRWPDGNPGFHHGSRSLRASSDSWPPVVMGTFPAIRTPPSAIPVSDTHQCRRSSAQASYYGIIPS